jgi:hypothetical protein
MLREMSRDMNNTNHSCASSTGSNHGTVSDVTVSDFDPENDAIMSTRQVDLNLSQRLPELRDTAKKYGRWNARVPEIAINTSAIGRAFPDFSQGGSSDDSMSIEIGRGAKVRQRISSTRQYSETIASPVVTIGDFQIMDTPPTKQSKSTAQRDTLRNSAHKESYNKRISSHKENLPPTTQSDYHGTLGYVSGASRTATGEKRRTLAELHARVADEEDASLMYDERPPTVTFPTKNTRFTSSRHSPLPGESTGKKNREASANSKGNAAAQTPSKPPPTPMANQTNQSFLLPNMPDISELVSGTFKDGTPVFTRSGRVQSRFSSRGHDFNAGHNGLDGIPVPQEEKDIFLSLQLLQEKVDSLETEKATTQKVMEELQREVYQLQSERDDLLKRRRADSALGDSGSDGEYGRDRQKLVAEKTKVEAQLKSLQNRLESANRKSDILETRLKANTAERDQAVKQLAEAYLSLEGVKAENETLRRENENLRKQLAQFTEETQETTRRWQQKEAALQQKLKRREDAVLELREMTREIRDTQYETTTRTTKSRKTERAGRRGREDRKVSSAPEAEERARSAKPSRQVRDEEEDHLRQSVPFKPVQSQERLQSRSRSRSRHARKQDRSVSRRREAIEYDEEVEETSTDASDEDSFNERTQTIHKDLNVPAESTEHTEGTNYSSILGHGEMERLRNILAAERIRQQDRMAANDAADEEDMTVRSTRSVRSENGEDASTRRRSSSRGPLTGILKNGNRQEREDTQRSVMSADGGRDTTTRSRSQSHSNKMRRTITTEMTSAFILPDITLHTSTKTDPPALSADARRVLDQLCHHDGANCTVCARVASFQTVTNDDGSTTKENKKILIVKPIPVSERMPSPGPYDEEPTMRPANTPGLALATVMKALEDELAHLKIELGKWQAVYNKHDASLSMRKRKALKAKVEALLKAIDTKADQIYNLYDVLEGQKHSGQELSEVDVEITLQSLGVDLEKLRTEERRKDGGGSSRQSRRRGGNGEDEDSELDLPWEGIEDTTEKTEGGRRQSWRL